MVNKKKQKVLVQREDTVQGCIEDFCDQMQTMAMHLFFSVWQRKQLQYLQENIPDNWAVSVADFAMNYKCVTQDEISSAFYNYVQVTLHPTVVYYKCPQCDSTVQEACVFISSDLKHDASAVAQFNDRMIKYLKDRHNIIIEHHVQFSDGAASQYKGKTSFYYLSQTSNMERAFFGSQHGKRICDSVGGVVKSCA